MIEPGDRLTEGIAATVRHSQIAGLTAVIAGGTYALASLWASLRKSGDSMAGVVFDQTGVWGALPTSRSTLGLHHMECSGAGER